MKTDQPKPDTAVSWGWKEQLWQWCTAIEDRVDRMALRLGDAILGAQRAEKIFGPHPARL